MRIFWPLCLFFGVFFFLSHYSLLASHSVGADLSYLCLGNNTYRVRVSFYRDCDGVSAGTSAFLSYSSASCGQSLSAVLPLVSSQELPGICPSQQNNTTCSGGSLPGIEQYVYEGDITLPANCTDWVLSYSTCCRNAAIDNLQDPDSYSMYVEATLNNTLANCDNSPIFTNLPVPFICVNQVYNYNHGAVDIDGDSLVYSLVTPLNAANDPIPWRGGYSANDPINTSAPFTFDTQTGQMFIDPATQQNAVVTVLVREYRNGVLIGSTMRDIQVIVINACSNQLPTASGVNGSNLYEVTICSGQNTCFQIFTNDVDAGDIVSIDWSGNINNYLPGATFTSNNANPHPTATFCWTAPTNSVGSNIFYVTVQDNNCPLIGYNYYAYTVNVVPPLFNVEVDSTLPTCFGDNDATVNLTLTGTVVPPVVYNWSPSPPVGSGGTNLAGGIYQVTVTDSSGCGYNLEIDLTIDPLDLVSDSILLFCAGATGDATVSATGGTPGYTYQWNTVPPTNGPTATNLSAGNYIVTITDANSCTGTVTVNVAEPPVLTINITQDSVTCVGSTDGSATVIASGGIPPYSYNWGTTPVQTTSSATGLAAGTYSVTLSDANGCNINTTATVLQPPGFTVTPTIRDVTCFGFSDGSAVLSVTGGLDPYTFFWNTTPQQVGNTVTGLGPGTYQVSISDINGCSQTNSISITEPPLLTLSLSSQDLLCFGDLSGSVTSSVTGGTLPYSYDWNTIPPQTDAIADGLPGGTYTVILTDSNGCNLTDQATVFEPTELIVTGDTIALLCFGDSTNASVVVTGGTPPYSINWSALPPQAGNTALNLTAGSYTVTVSDANNCVRTSTVLITEPPLLTAQMFFEDPTCFGFNNGYAYIDYAGGTSPYSFLWNTAPPQSTDTALNLTAGNYIVTTTDANGCSLSLSALLTEPTPLQLVLAPVDLLCFNDGNGVINSAANGGTPPYSFNWNTIPPQSNASATGLSGGTYSLTVTDAQQCLLVDSAVVFEPTQLQVTADTLLLLCFGDVANPSVYPSGGSPPYTYLWSSTPSQTTQNASDLGAGTYLVTITDVNACQSIATVVINEPSVLTGSTTFTEPTCPGYADGSITITPAGATPPYTYSWSTSPVQTTQTATGLTIGTYTVTITDQNGCSLSVATGINDPADFVITISPVDAICYLSATGSAGVVATGGTPPYIFDWSTTPPQSSTQAQNLSAGSYTVTLTDNNNCTATQSFAISEPPDFQTDISATPALCYDEPSGTATVSVAGATPPYSYFWYTIPQQTSATATNLPAALYIVLITDANGCFDTSGVQVFEPPVLASSVEFSDPVCFGEPSGIAEVFITGGTPSYSYVWSTSETSPLISSLLAGIYEVTVTDANGCTLSDNVTLTDPSQITATAFAEEDSLLFGQSTSLFVTTTSTAQNGVSYSWQPVFPLSCADCYSPVASPLRPTVFEVTLTDGDGCVAADTAFIFVDLEKVLFAPDAFTPNGDDKNDFYFAYGIGISEFKMIILDRWGEKLFETDDITVGWDGTFRGNLQPPDVYIYYIEAVYLDGEKKALKGGATLIR